MGSIGKNVLYRLRASDNPSCISFVNLLSVFDLRESYSRGNTYCSHSSPFVPCLGQKSGICQLHSAAIRERSRDPRLPGQGALSSYPEKFITTLSPNVTHQSRISAHSLPIRESPQQHPINTRSSDISTQHTQIRKDDVPHRPPPDRQGRRPSRHPSRQEIRELRRDEAGRRLAGCSCQGCCRR